MGSKNWQSDISQPNPYIKIQVAISILIDQNPSGVFTAASKKYVATTELIRQLYQRSWEVAKSKQQLKLFTFNLAKYGWACARTYPLRITRKVKNLVEFNQENPDKSVYESKEITEYNDIFRENLDPWNTWIDDMAKPNNDMSIRDWAWRKVYSMDTAREEFGSWERFKYVKPGGTTTDKLEDNGEMTKKFKDTELVEVYFYENRVKDIFQVHINGVPVIMSPLPISDAKGHKKLSLWQTYWNLRHAQCPTGIGIYEAIRMDQGLLDRVRNMTIDQLTLSIYKMFFYQGTNQLTETGDIQVSPGVGKQTLDPKNINFLEVPGPGKDAFMGLELFRKDLDEASGITDPLLGLVTGKTAFEIAQAKESALKRLKTPLENITDALDTEAYISVSLIQLLYSIPEVMEVADPLLIDQYMQETGGDPELFERIQSVEEDGSISEKFNAKVYPEFPLNLEADKDDNLIETTDTQFFRIKPRFLKWEGMISVNSQSVLTPSKQVDKAMDLEMYNMIIPLLGLDPMLYSKLAKNVVKLYDKEPADILPDSWMVDPEQMQAVASQAEPLIVGPEQQAPESTGAPASPTGAGGMIGKVMNSINPFK